MGWPESDVTITHYGAVEIEQSLSTPEIPTEHFSSQAIVMIQNFHGNVGAVQNDGNNTANVQQNIGATMEEISQVFAQMRQDIRTLPQEQQREAEEIIGELEEQAQKDKPKPSVLKSLGTALWGVAAPVLTEGAKEYLKMQLGVGIT